MNVRLISSIPTGIPFLQEILKTIHMILTTATIYYYGIDTKTYEPKVTKHYSQADDCFYIDNEVHDCHIKAFEKELVKEALYLKHNAQ